MKGRFFTLEGLDGSGKTVNVRNAINRFSITDHTLESVSEYADNQFCRSLRTALNQQDPRVNPLSEILTFYASRIEHTQSVIRPYLDQGINVLADRYYHSTMAYQSVVQDVMPVHNLVKDSLIEPDAVIFLDIDESTYASRVLARDGSLDSIESRGIEYFRKVRANFLAMRENDNFYVVDASKALNVVFSEVTGIISDVLSS
jgi:dTMP kinase